MNKIRLLFIDLDDTVYPPDTGAWDILGNRIYEFMEKYVDIPYEKIHEERDRLFHLHGTTMKGLHVEYGADINHYLEYVHDVDLSGVIKEDPALRQALLQIPQEKWIFTNACRAHAEQILRLVGIREFFTDIIDVLDTDPYCKPDPLAFARALGMHTVLVDPASTSADSHIVIRKLSELPDALVQGGFSINI